MIGPAMSNTTIGTSNAEPARTFAPRPLTLGSLLARSAQ
jgi:hypothetical protein